MLDGENKGVRGVIDVGEGGVRVGREIDIDVVEEEVDEEESGMMGIPSVGPPCIGSGKESAECVPKPRGI